jgi:hypothetical protein
LNNSSFFGSPRNGLYAPPYCLFLTLLSDDLRPTAC